jgi:hypothetical protein
MIRFQELMARNARMISRAADLLHRVATRLEKIETGGDEKVAQMTQMIEHLKAIGARMSQYSLETEKAHRIQRRKARTLWTLMTFSLGTAVGAIGLAHGLSVSTGQPFSAIIFRFFGLG